MVTVDGLRHVVIERYKLTVTEADLFTRCIKCNSRKFELIRGGDLMAIFSQFLKSESRESAKTPKGSCRNVDYVS